MAHKNKLTLRYQTVTFFMSENERPPNYVKLFTILALYVLGYTLEKCIYKRCHHAALGKNDQQAQQTHHHDDRQQPVFLAEFQKFPEFSQ